MNTLKPNAFIPRIKKSRKDDYVFIFENLELAFEKNQLKQITKDWNNGLDVEKISKKHKRHSTEVLLALIYQASNQKIKRPFAFIKK